MDPITFTGLVASVIEIANFFRQIGRTPTPEGILREFRSRERDDRNLPWRIEVTDNQIIQASSQMLTLESSDKIFIERIQERCLKRLEAAARDYNLPEADLDIVHEEVRHCVCDNIAIARRRHQGSLTSDPLKDWFRQFGCNRL